MTSPYQIVEIKGQRVVRRRRVEVTESRGESAVAKTMDEPRVQRVVKRKIATPAPVETETPAPARKRGRPRKNPVAEKRPKRSPSADAKKKKTYPSGQNGPAVELAVDDLNEKERRIVEVLNGTGRGERPEMSIAALGTTAFPKQTRAQGMSWVRNSLRRVVRAGYAERGKRGSYRITDGGRRRWSKAA